jgi:hypothetical protein
MVMVYYSKGFKLKISKGNKAEARRDHKQASKCPLSLKPDRQDLILLSMICDNRHEYLPTREAPMSLGVHGFH